MNEINIKFMSDDALNTIKADFEKFSKLMTDYPNDNTKILENLPSNPFITKKFKIKDFELKLGENDDFSEVEYENSIILYEHLNVLPRHILSDERFWAWLNFDKCYAAALQSMPIGSGKHIIKDHFLFGQGRRRGIFFGTLSRCYYRIALSYDVSLDDEYELSKFVYGNIYRIREMTWRAYSNLETVVRGALKGEKEVVEKYQSMGIDVEKNKIYSELAKYISQLGSVMLLDIMDEDFICEKVKERYEELININKTLSSDDSKVMFKL